MTGAALWLKLVISGVLLGWLAAFLYILRVFYRFAKRIIEDPDSEDLFDGRASHDSS